jgi:uncharacterized protein
MIPLRLVIDTNVIVSAAIRPDSLQRSVLLLALKKPARLFVSSAILAEYRTVLARPKLRIRKGARRQLLALIAGRSHDVQPSKSLQVASDADDNRFLECADEARADYLITGNLRHFPKYWKSTKIVSPREFIELIGPHLVE